MATRKRNQQADEAVSDLASDDSGFTAGEVTEEKQEAKPTKKRIPDADRESVHIQLGNMKPVIVRFQKELEELHGISVPIAAASTALLRKAVSAKSAEYAQADAEKA